MAVEKKSRLVDSNADDQDDQHDMERDSNKAKVKDNSGFVAIGNPKSENGCMVPKDRKHIFKNKNNYTNFDENSDEAGCENNDDLREKQITTLKTSTKRKLSGETRDTTRQRKRTCDNESLDDEIGSISTDNDALHRLMPRSQRPGAWIRTSLFCCVVLTVLYVGLQVNKDGKSDLKDKLQETVTYKDIRLQPSKDGQQMKGRNEEDDLDIADMIGLQSIKDKHMKGKHELGDTSFDNEIGSQSINGGHKKVKHEVEDSHFDIKIGLQSNKDEIQKGDKNIGVLSIKHEKKKVKQESKDAIFDNNIRSQAIKDVNKKIKHEDTDEKKTIKQNDNDSTNDNKIVKHITKDEHEKVKQEIKDATIDNTIRLQSTKDEYEKIEQEIKDATIDNKIRAHYMNEEIENVIQEDKDATNDNKIATQSITDEIEKIKQEVKDSTIDSKVGEHSTKEEIEKVKQEVKDATNHNKIGVQSTKDEYEKVKQEIKEDVTIDNKIGAASTKDEYKKVNQDIKDETIDNKIGAHSTKVKQADKDVNIDNEIGAHTTKEENGKVRQDVNDAIIDNKIGVHSTKDENKKGKQGVKDATIHNNIGMHSTKDENEKVKQEVKDATIDHKIGGHYTEEEIETVTEEVTDAIIDNKIGVHSTKDEYEKDKQGVKDTTIDNNIGTHYTKDENLKVKQEVIDVIIDNTIGVHSTKDENEKVKQEVIDAIINNKIEVHSLKDENNNVEQESNYASIVNTIEVHSTQDGNNNVEQVKDATFDIKIGSQSIKDELNKVKQESKDSSIDNTINSEIKTVKENVNDLTIDNTIGDQSNKDEIKKPKDEVKESNIENKVGMQSIKDGTKEIEHEFKDASNDETKEKSTYTKINITNDADYNIREELDEADSLFQNGKVKNSMDMFSNILNDRPSSPRALWGYVLTNERSAKWTKSMVNSKRVISSLNTITKSTDVPRDLIKLVIPKLVQTYVFNLPLHNLEMTWKFLSQSENHDQKIKRLFAMECERYARTKDLAENVYTELIEIDPNDCISMAMLGKAYNLRHKDHKKAAEMLQKAINIDCNGVRNPMYYYQLGDAYIKLGEREKANGIHNLGVERGLFLSRDQRAYHNAETPLTGRPWWSHEETTYGKHLQILESNWEAIRDEALDILGARKSEFELDRQGIIDEGTWKKLSLYHDGKRDLENCKRAPRTCSLIGNIRDSTTLTRGQIKFSVIHPGSHLWAHCGPTNVRIRAHLGLQIPEGSRIRVGNETRTWIEGKFIIFDDSFEHEVWHDGTSGFRLVLIVDFWHPELTLEQRNSIKPI